MCLLEILVSRLQRVRVNRRAKSGKIHRRDSYSNCETDSNRRYKGGKPSNRGIAGSVNTEEHIGR